MTKQDGDSRNYILRAVLLQPRAQIILLQQAGTAELAGSVQEGQERLVCLQTGISSHLTEVWYTANPVLLPLCLY